MRYAFLALALLALLAAAPAYEWRGSNGREVPAIELRLERPPGEKSSKQPKANKGRKADRTDTKRGTGTGASSSGTSKTPSGGGTGGASPAPAPPPAPAGGDDEGVGGDDDGGGDDDDDGDD